MAVVGYGYWGANVARNVHAARPSSLVGIVDRDPARRLAAAAEYPAIKVHATLDDLIDDVAPEAVIVATPASTHVDVALAALERGRHVLVEKPMALSLEAAERIALAGRQAGLVVMVGHTFLYSPPVQRLREYVQSGDLGAIQYLYSQRLSLGRIRTDCNALWNLAPHDVSILLYLLEQKPVEVSARSLSIVQKDVPDVFFATIQFESGVTANVHVSWLDPRKVRLMTLVGDRKMAVFDDVSPDRKLTLYDAGVAELADTGLGEYKNMGEFQWRTRAGDVLIPRVPMVEPLQAEVEAFADACRGNGEPLTNASHGLAVIRTLTAIEESAINGGAPVAVSELEPTVEAAPE